MRVPHPALRATLSPLRGARGLASETLLPACGEKVPEGRMRGAILLTLFFAATASAQQYQEKITVERILIDARITDSRGNPILGLTPADFHVRIDGKPAKVESVDWIPDTAIARDLAD